MVYLIIGGSGSGKSAYAEQLMCVACPGFPVICRNCPVYISIRAIQLYCDMLIYAAFVFLSRFIIAVNKV